MMRQVYITVGAALVTFSASAQRVQQGTSIQQAHRFNGVVHEGPTTSTYSQVDRGSCLFFEDFEGGVMPAGWDIGPQVEQADQDNVPLGTFVDAWQVGNAEAANNGGFFTPPGTIGDLDVPPGNLFAFANDDGEPCNCMMSNIRLTTPAIDLTGQTGIGLTVRLFHNGNYGDSNGEIRASTDGGVTFTTIFTIPEAPTWQNVSIPLTQFENVADLRLQFQWDDGGEWVSGFGVDDVCVAQLAENDLAIARVFLANPMLGYDDVSGRSQEYRRLPVNQGNPLVVSAAVRNNGASTENAAVLSADVLLDGNSVGVFTSAPVTIASGGADTIVINTGYVPTTAGNVTVNFTLEGSGSDATPNDNTGNRTFRWTEAGEDGNWGSMTQDAGSAQGYFPVGAGFELQAAGARYEITQSGDMAYGLAVQMATGGSIGAIIIAELYSLDELSINFLAESEPFEVEEIHLTGVGADNPVFIPFTEPVPLDADVDYVGYIYNGNNDEVRIRVSGTLSPGGLWSVIGEQATFYTAWDNPAPMVRLYTDLAPVSVAELTNNGIGLGVNMPNPASDVTRISYSLSEVRDVAFDVMDVTGKVVFSQDMGRMPAGEHQFLLDVANLAAGTYIYTMTAGADRLSRRMVVTQ